MKALTFGLAGVLLAGGTVLAEAPRGQSRVEIAVKPGEAKKDGRARRDKTGARPGFVGPPKPQSSKHPRTPYRVPNLRDQERRQFNGR